MGSPLLTSDHPIWRAGPPRGNPGDPVIDALSVDVFTVPTDAPESDGTLEWDATTIVVVRPGAGEVKGLGYSYTSAAAGQLIADVLRPIVVGRSAYEVGACATAMSVAVRNLGRSGIAASAISAVDNALWDLQARLLGVPLVDLLGRTRDSIPAYGSGGFTSYSDEQLREQLGGWAADGFRFVKMKVGRDPERDPQRAKVACDAIGPGVQLFVDANGAFHRAGAQLAALQFSDYDVRWFEEPVSSDDVEGLRLLREGVPAGMAIAAGEYGWTPFDFQRWLDGGAVDVLQADATRCLGTSGFLAAAALAEAANTPLSAHCAPALHTTLACAVRPTVHIEWFHDHVRLERMLFDGCPEVHDGVVRPDRTRTGLGLELRERDAAPFLVWSRA